MARELAGIPKGAVAFAKQKAKADAKVCNTTRYMTQKTCRVKADAKVNAKVIRTNPDPDPSERTRTDQIPYAHAHPPSIPHPRRGKRVRSARVLLLRLSG